VFQGDVESISLMKPVGNQHEQGFLEYLEDIIGTERFKVPLAMISKRLEELNALWAEKVHKKTCCCYRLYFERVSSVG